MSDLFTNSLQSKILELEDSDTEDNFEQFEPVLSRAEEAFIKAKKTERGGLDYFESPVNKDVYQSIAKLTPAELKQQSIDTVKSIADVTPIIGDIKAATELPNDLSYAFELVESGYDEGDLKKMGLGGAFAMLSAMGIVPGVRIGAKAGKEAIKASIKAPEGLDIKAAKEVATTSELTNAMQALSKTQDNEISYDQITAILKSSKPNYTSVDVEDIFSDLSIKNIKVVDSLKPSSQYKSQTAPKKDIFGLTPKVQDELISDFEMLGNAQNQIVTNKQIKEVIEIKTGFTPNVQTTNEIQAALNDKGISTINSFDEFKKLTGQDIQELSIQPRIDYASTANEVKTKYLDKSKGIENIDEITKILNDQDKGITSPSAIKELASKQNNEVSKQQLFHILEHYKDAPLDEADYKATMKYFQNTEGVKIVDDAPPIGGASKPKKIEKDVIGGTFAKMDVDMTPDQKFLVDKIRQKKAQLRGFIDESNQRLQGMPFTENQKDLIDRINTIDFTGKKFDMRNRADQIEIAKLLPKPIRRAMIQELNRPVPRVFHGSAGVSQPYEGYKGTVYSDTTRAEVLEQEGFSPFTDFQEGVELGIGGSKGASGMHAELGKKMLSTSRDPLVSIKRAFGDLIPANVVSAPFPRGKVRGMTREEYTAPSSKSQYIQDDTAAGLPRTRHKEAEIAFSTPEELKNIRQLSLSTDRLEDSVDRDALKNLGKKPLEEKVRTGQRFATGVRDKINKFYTRMDVLNPNSIIVAKKAQEYYADLRNLLKDTQALGQFTEQYGARGTYDSLLQTLFNNTDRTVEKLGGLLPEGEKKENVKMLASVFERMKDKQFLTDTGKSSLRGVSDKKLKEMLKDGFSRAELLQDKPTGPNYEDLKRMVFLLTDKFNRGGLMARR
jgi:hypothetical protein